jgi:hypothetical protein
LEWHCGVCLYNNKPNTLKFMQDWYDFYQIQYKNYKLGGGWELDDSIYPLRKLGAWDTFTFWRLMNLEGYDKLLNIKEFPEDARWNFHNYHYTEIEGGKDRIVVYHHTLKWQKDASNGFEMLLGVGG